MARGSNQATTAATTAQNLSNTYAGQAADIGSTLLPQLESAAAHPSGMSPLDIARATTANQQSAGGATAGAVGQGLLRAARTRNAGGADAATASAVRTGGQLLSERNLDTQLENAKLKRANQAMGIQGMENLYNTNIGAGNNALGLVAPAVNANSEAERNSWDWATDLFDPIMGDLSSGASAFAKKGGG